MRCGRLNKSFFGWSLQTGTKVIGFVSLVAIIEGFSKGIIGLTLILSLKDFLPENQDSSSIVTTPIIQLVCSIIGAAVTVPLLIAATKNSRPKLLLPWLILGLIAFLMLIISIGYLVYASLSILSVKLIGFGFVSFALISLGLAISIYFWMVIYSYRQQLLEMETQEKTANNSSKHDI